MPISPGLPIGALLRFYCQPLDAEVDAQYNCLQNMCVTPPEEPFEVALWQYAVTTLAVVLGRFFSSLHEGSDS